MTDSLIAPADAAALAAKATDRESWVAALEAMTAEEGYMDPVGPRHWAFFTDAGTDLLVTFSTLEQARARDGQMPLGHDLAASRGWSHLCLIADGESWWRDPAVWAFFDRLVDDAFFEDFDQVLFYGAGPAAHAACAYSVTAPGAQVLAISPRATLTPALAGWDKRHRNARRLDFTSRYGYAPDMTEGAGAVVILHDPAVAEDAMHAALFHAPWVTTLATPLLGDRIEPALVRMGLLEQVIDLAATSKLDRTAFARLWRKRRNFAPYLTALTDKAEARGRRELAIRLCHSVNTRLRAPKFAKRLEKLTRDRDQAQPLQKAV